MHFIPIFIDVVVVEDLLKSACNIKSPRLELVVVTLTVGLVAGEYGCGDSRVGQREVQVHSPHETCSVTVWGLSAADLTRALW